MYTVYSPNYTDDSGLAAIGLALVMCLKGYQSLERGMVSQATQWVADKDSQINTLLLDLKIWDEYSLLRVQTLCQICS